MWIKIQLVCVCMYLVLFRTADGPSSENIKITGPESFITDGSRNLTLTCLATDADSGTAYNWVPATVACVDYVQNSGTCTLIPTPDQDNTTVVCTAIPSQGRQLSQANYTLNLNYPPQKPPSITSSRQGQALLVGDTVTCTVEGGKPLVTAVHMNCTNPDLFTDKATGGTSESSFRTISVRESDTTDDETTCCCRATWAPEPDLYTNTSSKTFQINGDLSASQKKYSNQAFPQNGSDVDNDSGIGMNGRSSPPEMSDKNQNFTPTKQQEGVLRKKSARTAAYKVTSITPSGQVSIKPAAPQPNAYQEPWDTKKSDMTLAGAPGGPPTPHNLGPKGDEYAMVSNPKNKTTITVGPKGDEYSTVAKHGKGDNTQGSPGKAQGPEDAASSQGPPLSMTSHPLDTPGYATLAQMAPDQGNQGDVTSSSGDAAASGSPVKTTSSSGDGTDNYDHFQRDGHDPKSASQGPDVQYSHIGNY